MAKLIVVCARRQLGHQRVAQMAQIGARLIPNNIHPRAPWISSDARLAIVVVNPPARKEASGLSVCLGTMFGLTASERFRPCGDVPDGSFLLCRSDDSNLEFATDAVGSRTLWWVCTNDNFFASTSQRAIVSLLGSFRLRQEAPAWMISAGCLGPHGAWDARLQRLEPDSRLILNRQEWTIAVHRRTSCFLVQEASQTELIESLHAALGTACKGLGSLAATWPLALSGGIDSRALLVFLRNEGLQRCITWGSQASIGRDGTDASLASALAAHYGLRHDFYPLDLPIDAPDVLMERFLVAGEGRVDHLSGYLDGFDLWRRLFDEGVDGIIRGDEGFGWVTATSEPQVRHRVGARRLADSFSDEELEDMGFVRQTWPERLAHRSSETLATWRDRLYHEFRIPIILAALNDLKSSYVEIANPLLHRSIIDIVRGMPDTLRTEKRLFRAMVLSMSPPLSIASCTATPRVEPIIGQGPFRDLIEDEIRSSNASQYLPTSFRTQLIGELNRQRATKDASPRKGSLWTKFGVDFNRLLLRAFCTTRMCRLLKLDAT